MKDSSVKVRLSTSKEHLVFSITEFNAIGIGVSTKTAALPISPEFDPDDVLAAAQELNWEVYGEADKNGYYKVREITADVEQPA